MSYFAPQYNAGIVQYEVDKKRHYSALYTHNKLLYLSVSYSTALF